MEIDKKVIILGLIGIIIILSAMIIGYFVPEKVNKNDDKEFNEMNSKFRHDASNYITEKQGAIQMDDEVIIAENSYKFFAKYYNKVDSKEIQENWDNFSRIVIPKYYKNIKNESEIEKYYNDNSNEIYLETGCENYNDFYNIIKKIFDNTEVKKLKLKSLKILDTITQDENYTYADIQCNYSENISINFHMKVFNTKNDDGVFIMYY